MWLYVGVSVCVYRCGLEGGCECVVVWVCVCVCVSVCVCECVCVGGGGVCRLKPKINMAINKAKNGYIPVSNLGVDTHNCANNYLVLFFFRKRKNKLP